MASAAILNGGRASRLGGQDKGLLMVGGRTIRDRQLVMLATLTDDILIAGGPVTGPFVVPVRVVPDRHAGLGPLAGIEAALLAARDEVVVVIACDMPAVSAPLLASLLAKAHDVDVVVPRTGSGYHPLCAVYRKTCLPAIATRIAEKRLAVRGVFGALRVREVSGLELAACGDPDRLLANVNTPADYDELNALLTHEL